MDADTLIHKLQLTPHPEGGYFRETYRSDESIAPAGLPGRYAGGRAAGTVIYFLLKSGQRSAFHRLASDEAWYYHLGSAAVIHQLHTDGSYARTVIGPDIAGGEQPQAVIPRGTWFGAEVSDPDSFILISCSVAPGFDFADFELAGRDTLRAAYPDHADLIERLTAS